MHMLRSADSPGEDLPWTGLFTGMLIGKRRKYAGA